MKLVVKTNISSVEKLFTGAEQLGENSIQQAFNYFRGITPEQTGNAKKNTTLDIKNLTINADYPYANILDQGRRSTQQGMRGSQQAPNGMSGPTIKELDRIVKKEIGKL
jgi:hypothetical protein